jgi:hypothetical protein
LLSDDFRVTDIQTGLNKDRLLTLENYCERYLPVLMCKTIRSVVKPILDHKKSLAFETAVDKLMSSLTDSILHD